MNYLQLTNDFLIETQAEDEVATLASIQDDVQQAAVWIRDAWTEIQRKQRWNFRWAVASFDTEVGKRLYTLSDMGLSSGDEVDLSRFYRTTEGTWLSRFYWRDSVGDSSTGTPIRVGQRPDNTVVLDPIPDEVLSYTFEYFSAPQILSEDGDTPAIDEAFHKAIVWKAIQNYAREQGNEWRGLYEAADREFSDMYGVMLNRYLPEMIEKVPLVR